MCARPSNDCAAALQDISVMRGQREQPAQLVLLAVVDQGKPQPRFGRRKQLASLSPPYRDDLRMMEQD